MNIAIYEDSKPFAQRLEKIVQCHTHYPPVINTTHADEMAQYIHTANGAHLYLLDILDESTGLSSGLRLADKITARNNSDLLVFLTAYQNHILGCPPYLTQCFSVIFKDSPTLENEIQQTIFLSQDMLENKCLILRHHGRIESLYIPHSTITYIETVGNHKVCIHCLEGQHTVNGTLVGLLKRLGNSAFCRCHNSYIVNRDNITRIIKRERKIILVTGECCYYSGWPFNPAVLERPCL